MEGLIESRISWFRFLLIALLLLGIFFLLRFLVQLLTRISLPWLDLGPTRGVLRYIQLMYEPLAILLAATLFFLVRPVSNGLLLLLIGLTTSSHIRNYFSGRLIALQDSLEVGKRIRIGEKLGRISRIGRLGIHLQSNDGQHYILYQQFADTGYSLISGEEVGGLYRLRVKHADSETKMQNGHSFMDMLTTAPYIDWSYAPEVLNPGDNSETVETRVLLREEDHLQELTRLIREWGYTCELIPEA